MARLLERLFKVKPKEAWASSGGLMSRVISFFNEGTELPDPLDFSAMAEMGFRRNSLVNACIRRVSRSVAEPQLKAVTLLPNGEVQTDTPQSGDALANLLNAPNQEQDQYEFFEQLLIHLLVAGNAFVYKVRPINGGPPVMLELIRPDLVGIIPGKNREEGRIKSYTVKVDTSGNKKTISKDDLIHFKMPDAFDEFWGLSPLYTISRYCDIDLQAADFLRSYFKNRGIPAGMLTFDKAVQKVERERVRDMWKDQFQGASGWHNVAVLDANVTYTALQSGIEKLNLEAVTGQTETRICMVFGVPPALVGGLFGLSKVSYSSMDGAERIFWTDTMSPMFARLSRKLTRKLAQDEFGEARQAIFDLSGVTALTENKSEIRKIALQGWRNGLLSRNQANKMLGLANVDTNGEVYLMTTNAFLQPVDELPAAKVPDPNLIIES